MNIEALQIAVNTRWSAQLDNPCHQSANQGHALVHLMKAVGKIASALNDAEHERRALRMDEVGKYLADMVICAARFSDELGNLDAACVLRLAEKFPMTAPTPPHAAETRKTT